MNKALFLDRDGVINEERDYVYRKADIVFTPGIFDVCRRFSDEGFLIFVITNQSGIARGYYTEDDFKILTEWMTAEFLRHEIRLTETYYCPFHPEAGIGKYRKQSNDRKPNPGMILQAVEKYKLDLRQSILVGDKEDDITAGKRAGIATTILHRSAQSPSDSQADIIINSLYELEHHLLPK